MRRKRPPAQCRSAIVPPFPNAAPPRAAPLTSSLQAPAQRRRFFFVLPRHAESGGGGSSVGGRDEAQALPPRRRARELEAERQRLSQHTGQRGLGLSRLRRLAFGLPVSVAPSLSLKTKPAPVSSANDDGGGLARCVQRAKLRECVRARARQHSDFLIGFDPDRPAVCAAPRHACADDHAYAHIVYMYHICETRARMRT